MEQFRLVLAVIISTLILLCWQYFFDSKGPRNDINHSISSGISSEIVEDADSNYEDADADHFKAIQKDYDQSTRVSIQNEYVMGSINLKGAKIDDLVLKRYNRELGSNEKVTLLCPKGSSESFYYRFGWLASDKRMQLPDDKTIWNIEANSTETNVRLYWVNVHGVKFRISFELGEDYMFRVLQGVENNSDRDVIIYPYSSINRKKGESGDSSSIVHEGALLVLNDKLTEIDFKDLSEESIEKKQQRGWVGFSDKYWLVALLPDSNSIFNTKITGTGKIYQLDVLKNKIVLEPGQSMQEATNVFAGAKNIDLLHKYQSEYNLSLFDRAVDFGILYFITKPIFLLLNYFYKLVGNFGIAILLLTVFIKLLLFPLAYKGFVSMNKLKVLQPRLVLVKEKYGQDAQGFQKAMIDLYKKEKVNPVSGCLPLLLQMPVFFALYKVLSVTIEMRHAKFFWWLEDLSAKDPTSIFNLFGLLPWEAPSFLVIGVLPILMAITMHLQQSLNPAPTDPIQAKVMSLLPLIFLFVFAPFPSGLVLYWVWSNILSIVQQIVIKRLVNA
jgi:YidC/Oxa1 family membrane protein insertase